VGGAGAGGSYPGFGDIADDTEFDGTDVAARCADLVHRFGLAYGWTREVVLHDVPWSELVKLRERADDYQKNRNDFEAHIHGYEAAGDGGAAGSGLQASAAAAGIGARPKAQMDHGTSAWQQALKMGMQANAKKRRN
jgi:hypothetical protein